MLTLLGPFAQILPLSGLPSRGPIRDQQLTVISKGGILIRDGQIVALDEHASLENSIDQYLQVEERLERWQPPAQSVLLPGFIDCHTHICFAGNRAQDFALRNSGIDYLEIARAGGGIQDSVRSTRAVEEAELVELTLGRAMRSLRSGVTTVEVKSGYGLDLPNELKQLRAVHRANRSEGPELIPTCLAAHVVPKDFQGSPDAYLDMLVDVVLPQVGASRSPSGLNASSLANRVDIFIEQEAFTPALAKSYLTRAKSMGFDVVVHADQFHPGGSQIAVEIGALSADHLEASGLKEIELLANSDTIAVALPGASLGLGVDFTPARQLLDAGAILAIASDWNPGSAPMGDLLTQASILATYEKLTTAEVLAGLTTRAARALKRFDRGCLDTGRLADFSIFPTADYRDILYYQGQMKPISVWRSGRRLV
ncbi:MAG: imidazolonepropionase [Bacteroidota bacterium]